MTSPRCPAIAWGSRGQPVPAVGPGAVPRALRVPAAPQRRPAALAAAVPWRGPRLLLVAVQRHGGADGRDDVPGVGGQRVLVVGARVGQGAVGGREVAARAAVAALPVIGGQAGPRLLHDAAAAAPRAGGPGAPAAPQPRHSAAVLGAIAVLLYPLRNLRTQGQP